MLALEIQALLGFLSPAILIGISGWLIYTGLAQKISPVKLFLSLMCVSGAWLITALEIAPVIVFAPPSNVIPVSAVLKITWLTITVAILVAIGLGIALKGKRRLAAVAMGVICPILLTAPFLSWDRGADQAQFLASHQIDLMQHQDLWKENGPRHYKFKVTRICYCPPFMPPTGDGELNPASIVVFDKVPTFEAVSDDNQYLEEYQTIEMLFQVLQRAIDNESQIIEVTYDAQFGYPIYIRLDHLLNVNHDELVVSVESFEVIK